MCLLLPTNEQRYEMHLWTTACVFAGACWARGVAGMVFVWERENHKTRRGVLRFGLDGVSSL